MAIGSKDLTPSDLDGMDNERLAEELTKAKAELLTCVLPLPPVS